jgi:hypothetical protein
MHEQKAIERTAMALLEKVTVAREFFYAHRNDLRAHAKYLRAVAHFNEFILNNRSQDSVL